MNDLCDRIDPDAAVDLSALFVCRRCKALTFDPGGHTDWHGTVDSAVYPPPVTTVLDNASGGRKYMAAGLAYCAECNARLAHGHAPGCSQSRMDP